MQKSYQKVLDHQINIVSIICNDTDVLVLLTFFYWKLDLSSTTYKQGISTKRNIFDVRETVRSNEDIVPFIVAAHSLSGYDTVAPYHGMGKMTVVKRLKDGKKLSLLRQLDSDIDDVIKEATLFVSDCYGFQQQSMTKFRISPGAQKNPKLENQPLLYNLCIQKMLQWKLIPQQWIQLYTAGEEMN